MSLVESIQSPRDLRALSRRQLVQLASEIRSFLITKVSRTGGHLGPNLGVVELTIAIHRVFDSPSDPIIFDTGHQSYVHKILTGRAAGFDTLRQRGGLSGYPEPAESVHDWVSNSHASTALSWAEGLAKGFRLRGEQRTVVAVVGDGALTGGLAWEALNTFAATPGLRLVVVFNDEAYGAEVHHFSPGGEPLDTVVFGDTDLAAVGRGHGFEAVTVRSPDDLSVVRDWVAGPRSRPMLIDAKVTRDQASWWLEEAFRGH